MCVLILIGELPKRIHFAHKKRLFDLRGLQEPETDVLQMFTFVLLFKAKYAGVVVLLGRSANSHRGHRHYELKTCVVSVLCRQSLRLETQRIRTISAHNVWPDY